MVGIGRDTISGLDAADAYPMGRIPSSQIVNRLGTCESNYHFRNLGASRPDQLTDTLAASDLKIDAEIKNKLDEITAEYRFGGLDRNDINEPGPSQVEEGKSE